MNQTTFGIVGAALLAGSLLQAHAWQPAENSMLTPWGEKVNPENVWQEYPRPQMERADWMNLNGLWQYQVTARDAGNPSDWTGEILVPFALEAPLSGVGRRLESEEALWYRRAVKLGDIDGQRVLLHFEAVDYRSEAWINGEKVGEHVGGNLPFSFDVTDAVKAGRNELIVRVVDATDQRGTYQLRGKQKKNNGGIWYTPVSGIWQTVWLESVPENHISGLKIDTKIDGSITIKPTIEGSGSIRTTAYLDGKDIAAGGESLKIDNPSLWSPSSPTLYDLKVELLDADGKVLDTVKSYVGIREVGKVKDADGHWRFTLNGEKIFHLGPLDQGWWPGGLLTPPSDKATLFEMDFLKRSGFNMIRKHKKVEPRRYYYHCDKMGFLIWQDQVSGGAGGDEWPKWKRLHALLPDYDRGKRKQWWDSEKDPLNATWPDWAHEQYMAELKTMIDTLYNHPSVVVWTTFNERWGQHRSMEVGKWVEKYDPSRLLNIASGGNFFEIGDIADQHQYPHPDFPLEVNLYNDYVKVVGEYGGHGWPVDGHLWKIVKRNWGYGGLPESIDEYRDRYAESARILGELKEKGIAAGVYTQTTDVEVEINGLMTYDRKVIKIPAEQLNALHEKHGLK